MAGTQTAGYDMVIQFSEDFYEDIIGSNFDMSQVVPQILELLHIDEEQFSISVSLDYPTDVVFTTSIPVENPIDISIDIGENGASGDIRIVVGAVMLREDPEKDILTIDFKDHLYYAKATYKVTLPVVGEVEKEKEIDTIVKSIINQIPVMPIPVTRNTTDPKVAKRADFKIIDDTSVENENVLSTMLTFGGGSNGRLNQLDSFVDDSGAMGIFFGWLCRLIIPKLEESLGIPANSFTNTGMECKYDGNIEIDEDEDIYLKSISLKLVDGYIEFKAKVYTDGFCYEATGDVSAKIKFIIENGRLKVVAEVGDPDIDLDIPFLCYIGVAVLGALTGGALLGIIGAVVGVILIPLITWIVAEIVEGTFDSIADSLRDSVNNNLPEVDMQAYGIEILFQDVFIDDVIMKTNTIIHEAFPIRAEGTVHMKLGQGIDLDRGIVHPAENALNDINWIGSSLNKYLETGCQAAIANSDKKRIDEILHYQLTGFDYKTQQKMALDEFGHLSSGHWYNPFYHFIENKKVLAVRTNGNRYSLIQIVELEENDFMADKNAFVANAGDWIKLRYKTFGGSTPHVEIVGDFSCPKHTKDFKELSVAFSAKENQLPYHSNRRVVNSISSLSSSSMSSARMESLSNPPLRSTNVIKLRPAHKGDWIRKVEYTGVVTASLRAIATNTRGTPQYLWRVATELLQDNTKGSVNVDGVKIDYDVRAQELLLTAPGNAKIELLVDVNVLDADGCSVGQARCLKHDGKCVITQRYTPTWKEYRVLNKKASSTIEKKFILREQ